VAGAVDGPVDARDLSPRDPAQDVARDQCRGRVLEQRRVWGPDAEPAEAVKEVGPAPPRATTGPAGDLVGPRPARGGRDRRAQPARSDGGPLGAGRRRAQEKPQDDEDDDTRTLH